MNQIKWLRVNDEPFEYAIQQGPHGDEFVKLLDGACLRRELVINDGWPAWFPASPRDTERGEELFVGGYTWTINADDGPKHYKYYDRGWHRISEIVNDKPMLATVYPALPQAESNKGI